jgi:nucleotide-binding universal stress UspA family protein
MQNILVALDFSQPSKNAAFYAAHLAEFFVAKLILFNAYSMPSPLPESGIISAEEDFKETSTTNLQEVKDLLLKKHSSITISIQATLGDAETALLEECETGSYDAVVLGIAGKSAKVREFLLGSTASAVAKKSKIFAIIVPEEYNYKKINNIAFACDYKSDLDKNLTLTKVNYLVKAFSAKLFVFNIITKNTEFTTETLNREVYVDDKLAKISPEIVYSVNDDVTQGLIDLVKEHQIDLLITSPQQHNYFYEWFKESNTKKLAFHTPVPLLSFN